MVCFPPSRGCLSSWDPCWKRGLSRGGSGLSPWHQHVRPSCSNLETQTWVRFLGFLPRVKCPLLLGAPSLPAGQLRCSACRLECTGWGALECWLPAGGWRSPLNSRENCLQAPCWWRTGVGAVGSSPPALAILQMVCHATPSGSPGGHQPSPTPAVEGPYVRWAWPAREVNSITFSQLIVTGEKIQS